MRSDVRRRSSLALCGMMLVIGSFALSRVAFGQELGGAGTIQGTVKDPTGGVMQSVEVKLANPVSGFSRTTTTDATGRFVFRNLPPNPYHLSVAAQGFNTLQRDVDVRSAVPTDLNLQLALAGTVESVSVVGHAEDLLERDPTAHTDVDENVISKLPLGASGGLNQIITLASPGVVSDSNGFFHPVGDHAQTQFSIDNQPITDQQSRVYSNQISPDAVQSMELVTGVPPAEYGDKSSLVVHIVTKSGLDQPKPTGSIELGYGSFKTPTFGANIGGGSHTVGNFLSVSGMRSDRYLDPPEFTAFHDAGNNVSLFDRLDAHPNDIDTFHLNVQVARSSFDVPNTLDALDQNQHQSINSFNIAPGYSRILGSKALLTANGFVRQDRVNYTPSADPFADQPATVSQNRRLTNFGGKVDFQYTSGAHNVKLGGTASGTKLTESFTLGFTDPTFNSPCLAADGTPSDSTALRGPSQCVRGLTANPDFQPGLLPFDLTRNGVPFVFNGAATIKEEAAYIQDDIHAGSVTLKLGVRLDHYDGLTTATLVEPRVGISYAVPTSGTVLRASYGRTLETPYNENLLLSAGVGANDFVGAGQPLAPGTRDHVDLGVQQAFGRWIVADFGYFYKRTTNGYDFNVLFNTPVVFPIAWDHSRLPGLTGRVNLVEHGGFSAFVVMAHTDAFFSPPSTGGVLVSAPPGEFRIDHDQKFNQTTNLQYVFNKPSGAWASLVWRYDSGLISSGIGDVNDLLTLTAAQQTSIHLSCGSTVATLDSPITNCAPGSISTPLLRVPAAGTGDVLNNPTRVAPRNLFDLGIGADNLLHGSKAKLRVRFSVINLTNKEALYNFLSTFTGTHFVTPRAYQVQVGVGF
jgi:hypothetical protein